MNIVKFNRSAKVNSEINCAYCGKTFKKIQYSQVFCCSHCKDRYWNQKGDRHSSGYYERYDEEHPERKERARYYAIQRNTPLLGTAARLEYDMAVRAYATDEEFRRYVNETEKCGGWDDHACNVDLVTQYENYCNIPDPDEFI